VACRRLSVSGGALRFAEARGVAALFIALPKLCVGSTQSRFARGWVALPPELAIAFLFVPKFVRESA
jgi:hypothetical protein